MRPVGSIRAALDQRDLLVLAEQIARAHFVTLEQIRSDSQIAEICEARHALWAALFANIKSLSILGRIFGCDHSTIRWGLAAAESRTDPKMARVLLDDSSSDRAKRVASRAARRRSIYELWWEADRVNGFGIVDRSDATTEETTWYPTLELALADPRATSFRSALEFWRANPRRVKDDNPAPELVSGGEGGR